MRYPHRAPGENPEGKMSLGKPKLERENNIKAYLKYMTLTAFK